MKVGFSYGVYDILRAKDLDKLDREIQLSKEEGNDIFGLGIYDKDLCDALGIDEPLKDQYDRMKIMEQIRGVDFVFPVSSLDGNIMRTNLRKAFSEYIERINNQKVVEKDYEIGYAPGTYDLFHMGHLENLLIASEKCKKLIVGVKSNELVEEQKNRTPEISDEERMEILRHFKFVYDAYKFHTRDLKIVNDWVKSKYGKEINAIFLGSDLKNIYKDTLGMDVIYTPRDPLKMETRSTTAYIKKIRSVRINNSGNKKYTGNIDLEKLNNNQILNTDKDINNDIEK